jgi:hypothetical protein
MKNKLTKVQYGAPRIYDVIYYETLSLKKLEAGKGGKR